MAFVPDYDYDVFVSYAHVDNQRGWVTAFVKELEARLAEALGRPRPTVWMDHQIRGNEPLDQISSNLQCTAALLIIRSRGYLKSDWCRKELFEFANQHYGAGNRIFIAHLDNAHLDNSCIDNGLLDFGDRPGYDFWVEDPETKDPLRLGYPETQEQESKYYKNIQRLVRQLATVLEAVATERGSAPKRIDKVQIFLAEVPDEALDKPRERIEKALSQAGFVVLPDDPQLQNDLQQFTEWARKALPSCKGFIQLLNEKTDKRRGRPEGLPALQYRLAQEAKVPLLFQWRASDLDLSEVQDPEHRQLLEGEHVRTGTIEELITEILAKGREKAAPAFTPKGIGPWIFINSDLCDRELALKLRDWFKARRFSTAIPLDKAKTGEARKYRTDNLRGCAAVLLVQGECKSSWISQQLMEIAKQERQRAEKLRALGLCQLPPPDKQEPEFLPDNLKILDGQQGLTPAFWAKLETFTDKLHG